MENKRGERHRGNRCLQTVFTGFFKKKVKSAEKSYKNCLKEKKDRGLVVARHFYNEENYDAVIEYGKKYVPSASEKSGDKLKLLIVKSADKKTRKRGKCLDDCRYLDKALALHSELGGMTGKEKRKADKIYERLNYLKNQSIIK